MTESLRLELTRELVIVGIEEIGGPECGRKGVVGGAVGEVRLVHQPQATA